MVLFSGLLRTPIRSQPRPHIRSSPNRLTSLQTPTNSQSQPSTLPLSPRNPPSPAAPSLPFIPDAKDSSSRNPLIREESHLPPIEPEAPDLRELNNSLSTLAAIFPDVQIEVFREMLSSFHEESRLAVVTETLLKHKMKWVRGRYRVAKDTPQVTDGKVEHSSTEIPPTEKFRTSAYKIAVRSIAYQEFRGLSRSTINAILAEFNHAYTRARPTLVSLSARSWRFSLSSLILRRKPVLSLDAEHHPLVVWQSAGNGLMVPALRASGSPELDEELFDSLIRPIHQRTDAEREERDHQIALEVNHTEAQQHQALHDCECCFTPTAAFEELSPCDASGHLICFRCVRHSVNEAVFGQGWQRNIDLNRSTLRCVAATSDDCTGCIPPDLVRRALSEDPSGKEVLRKLDERVTEDSLRQTGLPLIRCPFCSYAEVDELYLPESQRSWRLKRWMGPSYLYMALFVVTLILGMIPLLLLLPVVLLALSALVLLPWGARPSLGEYFVERFHESLIRLRRKRLGLRFFCRNPDCGRASCMSCSQGWTDIHICHESSLLALRTQVELAMSLAIKRTCPRCNTSFVKSSGCNKLTCVCGYQMCYVCRKDIGNGEGYRHFCEHFRPNGGTGCTECSKCDLYRCEDTEVVVRQAREAAERQWLEKEANGSGSEEKIRQLLVERRKNHAGTSLLWWLESCRFWEWHVPGLGKMLDTLVECLIV